MGRKANRNKDKGEFVSGPTLKPGRDTDASDLESVISSVQGDYQASVADSDESTEVLTTVDAFGELVDNAMDKNVATRCLAMDGLIQLLRRTYIAETAGKHKIALCEIAEKNLRRTPEEALRAMQVASLLAIQLGLEVEDALDPVLASMCALFSDASQPEEVRANCAEALGLCAYFGVYRPVKRAECLNSLKQTWTGMKITGTLLPNLFASAVFAWALILERFEETAPVEEAIEELQPRLCAFLGSNSVDVRISAGEALAILHELAVQTFDEAEDFRFANHHQLKAVFDDMAVDSAKYHAKKDKRLQKFTFRQIIDAIFNESAPSSLIKFNKYESLELNDCHSKLLYDLLCHVFKGDLNTHLSKNIVLRDLFDLGGVRAEEVLVTKAMKTEKKNKFTANSKERNMHRNKQRDKKFY